MLPPPSDNVSSEDHRTSEGVLVRVYKPKDAASDLPIGLYIHSGGWACGDYIAEDHLIRQIAQSVPCVLVSVEYRLAPENPFPAALEDCFAAYGWMAKSAKQLGGDASKLFFVGGSAGGNLSLTTTLKVLDDGDPSIRPKGVFALCPAVAAIAAVDELPEELKQYEHPDAYEGTAMIDKAAVVTCGSLSLSHTALPRYISSLLTKSNRCLHWLLKPIRSPNLTHLPPKAFATTLCLSHNIQQRPFKRRCSHVPAQVEGRRCAAHFERVRRLPALLSSSAALGDELEVYDGFDDGD